jgi:hypothetical protein
VLNEGLADNITRRRRQMAEPPRVLLVDVTDYQRGLGERGAAELLGQASIGARRLDALVGAPCQPRRGGAGAIGTPAAPDIERLEHP